jgi:prepilin-type N-terminal cleavage/methylation domain-containing protein
MERRGGRQGWSLIELLIVVVVLAALGAWLLPGYLGSGKQSVGRTTIQAPIERAHGVECMENLRSVRAAITMAQQTEERFPASLNDLKLGRSILSCPVSKQPYVYNSSTGQVGCAYPPHRSY